MTPYTSKSGKNSGVEAFQVGNDFIRVKFKHEPNPYKYTFRSAGKMVVEEMKSLAIDQRGLSTFIAQNNPGFE